MAFGDLPTPPGYAPIPGVASPGDEADDSAQTETQVRTSHIQLSSTSLVKSITAIILKTTCSVSSVLNRAVVALANQRSAAYNTMASFEP